MPLVPTSKAVFVSHAVVDADIAAKIVDLLQTGIGLRVPEDVFCSSLQGAKIPPGVNFVDFVKSQISQPKIVILLISQNYFASQFCLAELGATWAMSHQAIPIVVPPLRYADLKSVLTGVQAVKIESPDDWNEVVAVFQGVLGLKPNIARWENKRDEFLAAVAPLIAKQPEPPIVPFEKHQKVESAYKDAQKEIADQQKRYKELQELYEKVKKAKDAKEVREIEFKELPEEEALEKLVAATQKTLGGLSRAVEEALYHSYRNEELSWPDGFGDDQMTSEMRTALQNKWLRDGSYGVIPNDEHPKIKSACAALDKLEHFIENASGEFHTCYESEHEEILSFTSREFWSRFIF